MVCCLFMYWIRSIVHFNFDFSCLDENLKLPIENTNLHLVSHILGSGCKTVRMVTERDLISAHLYGNLTPMWKRSKYQVQNFSVHVGAQQMKWCRWSWLQHWGQGGDSTLDLHGRLGRWVVVFGFNVVADPCFLLLGLFFFLINS